MLNFPIPRFSMLISGFPLEFSSPAYCPPTGLNFQTLHVQQERKDGWPQCLWSALAGQEWQMRRTCVPQVHPAAQELTGGWNAVIETFNVADRKGRIESLHIFFKLWGNVVKGGMWVLSFRICQVHGANTKWFYWCLPQTFLNKVGVSTAFPLYSRA